uniref:hypothetical protein n=1 Tax=Algoriphagus sp. TaxID=1872435 RepID=UPI0040475695
MEIRNKTKKGHRNDKNFILVDDIILPEGLEVTLDEIFNTKNSDMITVDKDNLLQSGVIEYLLAIKNGEKKVRIIRANKLQKINVALASAA